MERPIKILVTKIGLDGHDRGARVIASALREAGMEVIYTSPWQTIEDVVSIAIQEDVDIIAISSLAYDHLIIPKLMEALKVEELDDKKVIVGGIIPKEDEEILIQAGVSKIFHPGETLESIVKNVKRLILN
ncbi:cobalamin B12-binding domain-containing protein [Neobacillus massiliamazoniensis]|jgi:methylmalonyl-CoA mutase C-terminal domain/subunit|uniref:Methylmalonyl-CoA epimerase n=1 Tax=Neobacillus massiliamazoniensis TaxID=1499688 RepID=A0A0U1P472_9BACI|nr:cobalamin-dependent protein [Neobacillus massiliamazoniensis]CRK85119.1 methylmalonyl-CoA epimerase [Neobacillus massiliamazoniensis]